MKTRHLISFVALLALLCIPAFAEPLKLTIDQCFALNQALSKLDAGVTHVIPAAAKEGEEPGRPEIVHTAYDFTAATRLAIYRDQRALQAELDGLDKARASLVRKIWGERQPNEANDKDEMVRFRAEMNVVAAATVTVEITRLKPEDLLRAGNPIPTQVLLGLTPLLTVTK